ncbi:toll/interleukin-1 receptor domain-containing protein [bacterium]|nr:toll/interleukin-1 receptor domain-containing protein [bacterium]MBU1024479.1 toll/interleukin-1 receptor domain-containing protein [bacterium]
MPNNSEIFDVFLSHSHADAEIVEHIAQRLEDKAKIKVWLDKWILVPGKSWQRDIAKGLNMTYCCAVFLGGKTPSGWFRQEIERALDRQAVDDSFRVVAVLLPGADTDNVDRFLGLRSWVDFRDGLENDREFHRLKCAIRGVAPGRGPVEKVDADDSLHAVKENLSKIKQLLSARLIEKEIALEYQRKLLDGIIRIAN